MEGNVIRGLFPAWCGDRLGLDIIVLENMLDVVLDAGESSWLKDGDRSSDVRTEIDNRLRSPHLWL